MNKKETRILFRKYDNINGINNKLRKYIEDNGDYKLDYFIAKLSHDIYKTKGLRGHIGRQKIRRNLKRLSCKYLNEMRRNRVGSDRLFREEHPPACTCYKCNEGRRKRDALYQANQIIQSNINKPQRTQDYFTDENQHDVPYCKPYKKEYRSYKSKMIKKYTKQLLIVILILGVLIGGLFIVNKLYEEGNFLHAEVNGCYLDGNDYVFNVSVYGNGNNIDDDDYGKYKIGVKNRSGIIWSDYLMDTKDIVGCINDKIYYMACYSVSIRVPKENVEYESRLAELERENMKNRIHELEYKCDELEYNTFIGGMGFQYSYREVNELSNKLYSWEQEISELKDKLKNFRYSDVLFHYVKGVIEKVTQ